MPTIPDLLWNLLQGIASYQDVFLSIALVLGIFLLVAGVWLVRSANAPDESGRRVPLGLMIAITLTALLIGVPFFIPYPHADFLVPGVPLFPICLVLGLFSGLAFFRLKGGRPFAAALFAGGALALAPVVVASTSSLLGMGYTPNLIWTAFPLPAILAGGSLAWTLSTGRRYYAPYVLAWLAVVALVALPSYIGEMYGHQATLESATSAQRYLNAPEAGPLIDQSMRAEWIVSGEYVVGTLLLLVLPLVAANFPRSQRSVYAASH
ncbi:MAG: hypothetical protein ABJA50_04100 [Chloroflexota bacterium]